MIPLAIHGIGPVGAFGAGLDELRAALKGEKKVEPEFTEIETNRGFDNLPIFRASTKTLTRFIKSRELRRLDHFSRMALLGACLACEDSGQELIGERTGLIVASAYGASATTFSFLDSVIEDGDALASPTLFSNSVHNAAAAHIAKHLKITGPNLSLTQGRLSVPMALLTAAQWLAEGRVDTVLCGAVDEYCDVLGYCWQSYGNRKKTTAEENHHYSPQPDGLSGPGEGSLFFQLKRTQETNAPYGYLEKIELNSPKLQNDVPFIYSPDACSKNSELRFSQFNLHLPIDLAQICGFLPTVLAFDLAAAATMLYDQTLYLNDPVKGPQQIPFSGPTIGCLQADSITSQKPLTENCYWITNCRQEQDT
ncbi:MAG: beta-ketoacyl synthase chain length factor [Deltaproteobacteria bacterium]|nr:beta-ketoacyl synthase chain length factor [Candidatus Tharpella aukensis]